MNIDYQPGSLAPLIPKGKSDSRKSNKRILFGGIALVVILLCCIAVAIIGYTQRSRIPLLANLFASSTPTQTPTPTVTLTPTSTPTPSPLPAAKISGKVMFTDMNQALVTTVTLINTITKEETPTTTNAQGYYEFTGVKPGTYQIEAVIPDDAINACSNPRLLDLTTWQVVYHVTMNAWIPMTQTLEFKVKLGDNIVMSPPLVCK